MSILWLVIVIVLSSLFSLFFNYQEVWPVSVFLSAYLICYCILFVAMSLGWETLNRKRIYVGLHGELYVIPKTSEPSVSKKMPAIVKMRLRLGFGGGVLFVIFSIVQLLNSEGGFFWWSGSVVSGPVIIFSGIIELAAGMLGLYGTVVGKKLGGHVMIVAGVIGLTSAPIFGVLFGSFLIIGGILALLEKPKMSIITEKESVSTSFHQS